MLHSTVATGRELYVIFHTVATGKELYVIFHTVATGTESCDTVYRVATGNELLTGHPLPHIAVTGAHFFLPVEITQHEKVDREREMCGAVEPVGTQTPP
jgi:hypothetical protein